jgi:hypothetical protein
MMKKLFACALLISLFASCTDDENKKVYNDTPETMPASDTITSNTSNFKGVNWADTRDNFVDTWLILSGLDVYDDEATILAKTETILNAFKDKGANTVRLPINPPTVLQDYWPRYAAIISKAAAMDMKVVLAYWEGNSSKDGKIDIITGYNSMWDRVVAKYKGNQNVYFEVMNEPHGYSENELKTVYGEWLDRYADVPKHRILLDGTGYATGVNEIGADARFNGCLLSFHYYTWFTGGYETTADWERPVKNLNYPERTVMTEFGVPMTAGKAFTSEPGYDFEVNYMQGITAQLKERGIGSMYWPGLRTNDTYSMFSYNNNVVTVNNESGLKRLQYVWSEATANPFYADFAAGTTLMIRNRNSSKAVDVNGGSTNNGGNIIQWDYSGGNNQQWIFNPQGNGYYAIINKNSNKALDVNGASNNAGAGIIQWDYSGGDNQQWQVTSVGFGYYKIINKNSGQSLDVNGGSTWNGGDIIQWYWSNGNNQQWLIKTP